MVNRLRFSGRVEFPVSVHLLWRANDRNEGRETVSRIGCFHSRVSVCLPFAEAFSGILLAAPSTLANELPARQHNNPHPTRSGSRLWIDRRSIAAGFAAAMVLGPIGILVGRLTRPDMNNWREAVAQYHKLYSDRTLAGIAEGRNDERHEIAAVGKELGLNLSLSWLEGVDARYRRSQILTVDGGPLAQIVLTAADEQVLAYCIRQLAEPDAAPKVESRAGLAVVHWTIRNFGFLIAGKTSQEAVLRAAKVLHQNAQHRVQS